MLSTSSPFSFILFGASGHLAQLKIYPALYTLALKNRLPEEYNIVGFARTDMTEDVFRQLVAESIKKDMIEVNEKTLKNFLSHVHYHQGNYDACDDFIALNETLQPLEKNWKEVIRLTYLSIPPAVFPSVLMNLCASGLHHEKGKFRCIVEKPVGDDLSTAEQVYTELNHCFAPEEIYLLDHYLGKEAVRNAYYLRLANPILERLFKNTLIDHVQITATEPKGIEGRAGYFEHSGTFRDMFQSHMMMILSLLTMRLVEKDESFQSVRLNALEQFYLPPAKSLHEIALQGQYEGYTKEEGVSKDSRTNTYAALKLMTRISRWQGIPFYLHSGKKLDKKETRISMQFQEPRPVGKGAKPNRLDIILQGEAGMRMYLQTKIGGTEPEFRPLILEDPLVCVGDCLPEHGILLLEAIHGKQQWYLSFEEVRTAWRLVDPVQSYFDDSETPLFLYKERTSGPNESDAWMKRDGKEWF
jgi:glucose-6-phosphate 1-dehydrogenase